MHVLRSKAAPERKRAVYASRRASGGVAAQRRPPDNAARNFSNNRLSFLPRIQTGRGLRPHVFAHTRHGVRRRGWRETAIQMDGISGPV